MEIQPIINPIMGVQEEAAVSGTFVNMPSNVAEHVKTRTIDIIVPTHNNLEKTIRCINRLYENTTCNFNLVVVDDSTDITPVYFKELQKEKDNITFIHSEEPFKSGNQFFNEALKHCKSDYVATVMNSVFVEPEWEIVATELLEKDPLLGIVGIKCIYNTGTIESAGVAMYGFTPIDLGRDMPSHRFSSVYECVAVQWACAILRRKAIPVLEEDVYNGFKGWDDIDNCFVMRKNGWKVAYCGLGVGIHETRSTRADNSVEAYIANRENAESFYRRWGYLDAFLKSGQPTVAQLKEKVNG